MPRHDPGDRPRAEPGPAGRRLSAAVGTGARTGLLDQPPLTTPSLSPGQDSPAPKDSPDSSLPRFRWRTGRRAAALLCLVSTLLLGWFWWQAGNWSADVAPLSSGTSAGTSGVAGPEPATAPATAPGGPAAGGPAGADTDGSDASGDGAPAAAGTIIVHVAGAVVRAGVVELPRGSRLHEAIAAAGGASPGADPDQLNLAAVLDDGQKVLVPRQGETLPAASAPAGDPGAGGSQAGAGAAPSQGAKINLNTAGADELATLPRVGPVLAQRIVDWRTQHGPFRRVEELDAVDGVGPKMLAALLPLVRV